MVAHARRLHPHLRFEVGSATELDPAPASLGGVLAWWSLFHLPRATVAEVVATLAGALVPGGQLAWGTHVGDGEVGAHRGLRGRWDRVDDALLAAGGDGRRAR